MSRSLSSSRKFGSPASNLVRPEPAPLHSGAHSRHSHEPKGSDRPARSDDGAPAVPLARLLSRAAATLLALGALAAPALAQPKPGGTLRFVMKYEPPTLAAINNSSTPTTSPEDLRRPPHLRRRPQAPAAARHRLGSLARRPRVPLHLARGRDLARRQALHLGRRRLLDPAPQAGASTRARAPSRMSSVSTRRTRRRP